jgi:nucleotide-binding universal stress UspA family protein
MYKSIQICVTGHGGDTRALDAGFAVAEEFLGHAGCLHVRFDPRIVAARLATFDAPGAVFAGALEREDRRLTAAARTAFDDACRSHKMPIATLPPERGASAEWIEITGDECGDTVSMARFHDLVVADRKAEFGQENLGAVIVSCGRPVLVPSMSGTAKPFGPTIAIAWKETAEAARAVTAALPFLTKARRVVVLSADEAGNDAAATLRSAERLADSLRWHGIKSEGRLLVPGDRAPSQALFDEAATLGAELVVMGAYGRNRVREFVFGGFTRSVLNEAPLPVLLCH